MTTEKIVGILLRAHSYWSAALNEEIIIAGVYPDDEMFFGAGSENYYREIPFVDIDFERDRFFEIKEIQLN